MMTLKELKTKIGDSHSFYRKMTEKELKKFGGKIIATCHLDSQSCISVYENGGVIFCDGSRRTIFSVYDCKKACWIFATEESSVLGDEEYENTPWNVCLYLEGMRRIEKNVEKSIAKRITTSLDDDEILLELPSYEKGFSEVEWNDFLGEALQELTPEQRIIFSKCMLEGLNQRKVSRETGISQTSSRRYDRAFDRRKPYQRIRCR